LLGEVATEELEKMAVSLVLVRKDHVQTDFMRSWNWLIIGGTVLLVGLWFWSRRQRSAKTE
ncbi:MAG: LPXTG cell wall anchor domain-containing protein, partial [bacterium]